MEVVNSIIIIAFVFGVVFYVEIFMYNPLSQKEISSYQRVLDRARANTQLMHGIEIKLDDAETQLRQGRKEAKAFTLIFSGMAIALAFILLLIFTDILSFSNIAVMCISAIILISYGIIKISESKKLATLLLIIIFILGTLAYLAFGKLMEISPYAYYSLGVIIIFIEIFILFGPTTKKA